MFDNIEAYKEIHSLISLQFNNICSRMNIPVPQGTIQNQLKAIIRFYEWEAQHREAIITQLCQQLAHQRSIVYEMTKKVRQIDLHRIHLQNTNKACESASNDFSLSETTMREQHLLRLKLNNANKELQQLRNDNKQVKDELVSLQSKIDFIIFQRCDFLQKILNERDQLLAKIKKELEAVRAVRDDLNTRLQQAENNNQYKTEQISKLEKELQDNIDFHYQQRREMEEKIHQDVERMIVKERQLQEIRKDQSIKQLNSKMERVFEERKRLIKIVERAMALEFDQKNFEAWLTAVVIQLQEDLSKAHYGRTKKGSMLEIQRARNYATKQRLDYHMNLI